MCSSSASGRRARLSLAAKLAMLYGMMAFSVLLVASGYLYWSVLDHLQREHESLLAAKIHQLRFYFTQPSDHGPHLHDLINTEHEQAHTLHSSAIHPDVPHHVFIRILDAGDGVLVQSEHLPDPALALKFPEVDTDQPDRLAVDSVTARFDQRYLLGSVQLVSRRPNWPEVIVIQGLLELDPDQILLSEYRNTLVGVLVFGVLASALGGFWVTRRGLRPLREMTSAIQRIDAQQLNQRVGSAGWPAEVELLAASFDNMLARLDQSFEQLTRFSEDLAHELRTPVNNLMGEAEVALSRERDADGYRQVLESNLEECARLARMIDELLFLARAKDPETRINPERLMLTEEFEKVRTFYEGLASEKGVALQCDAGSASAYADPALLRRVLINLMSNALRHTPPGGDIRLRAEPGPADSTRVYVEDNGEGIAGELLPRLFDRFFRVDPSRHHDSAGSGLGLSIVKSIMDMHRGEVLIHSTPGEGTRVELVFPAEDSGRLPAE